MKKHLDTWILAALTLITTAVAVLLAARGMASWLEACESQLGGEFLPGVSGDDAGNSPTRNRIKTGSRPCS